MKQVKEKHLLPPLPSYLMALTVRGFILTVNDYLRSETVKVWADT
jgi:hypothetical protein